MVFYVKMEKYIYINGGSNDLKFILKVSMIITVIIETIIFCLSPHNLTDSQQQLMFNI